MKLEHLIRPSVKETAPYSTIRSNVLDLSTNANMLGENPVCAKVLTRIAREGLSQYPTLNSDTLRSALARRFGRTPDNYIVGNGSDEIIDIAVKAFVDKGEVVCCPTPSFSMYHFYAGINMGKAVKVKLAPGFQLDPKAMLKTKAKVFMLCSPNNPTSNLFRKDDILEVIEGCGGIFLLDEAYVEFCGRNMSSLLDKYDNLIISRTMSKAYGLAGSRVGYAMGGKEAIAALNRAKPPYNLNIISEIVASEALRDNSFINKTVAAVKKERAYLYSALIGIGAEPYRSDANFIMAKLPVNSAAFSGALLREGILIKDLDRMPMLKDHIRITVGTRNMNNLFIKKADGILSRMKR